MTWGSQLSKKKRKQAEDWHLSLCLLTWMQCDRPADTGSTMLGWPLKL